MKYGIDVSTWQEGLDFERARILGYDFCICRIGYTGNGHTLDDLFVHNINEAKANGMEQAYIIILRQRRQPKPKRKRIGCSNN